RTIILGIGAYQKSVYPEMDKMIAYGRKIGAGGVAFFRYEHVKNFNSQLFSDHAYPTVMPWLEIGPPEAPINLSYKMTGNKENSILLQWDKPADNFDQIKYYSIYKFESGKQEYSSNTLVDIVSSKDNSFTVYINKPKETKYYFSVKSVNVGWIESTHATNICEVIIPALYNFAKFIKGNDKVMLLTSGSNSILYVNSSIKDKLFIKGSSDNEPDKTIYKGELLAGKNYININSIKNFSLIKLEFATEGKTLELKLN
nr:fibronectin type III domain-containing protein [Melioribacteraceae bacterium]